MDVFLIEFLGVQKDLPSPLRHYLSTAADGVKVPWLDCPEQSIPGLWKAVSLAFSFHVEFFSAGWWRHTESSLPSFGVGLVFWNIPTLLPYPVSGCCYYFCRWEAPPFSVLLITCFLLQAVRDLNRFCRRLWSVCKSVLLYYKPASLFSMLPDLHLSARTQHAPLPALP